MIHPERGLATGSGACVATGALGTAEATLAGAAGGEGSDFVTGGSGAAGAGTGGAIDGDCSVFTAITVVIVACVDSGGVGVSCRLSDGNGVKAAVRMLPGCTATVFTAFGLIGSVEPGSGASEDARVTDATRTGAEPVRSSSFSLSFLSLSM